MSALTWLGLDPSLTEFGWAVFRDPDSPTQSALVDAGVWQTARDAKFKKQPGRKTKVPGVTKDTNGRVRQLGELLDDLVQKYHPVILFTEGLALPFQRGPGGKLNSSVITISTLGRIRGVIDGISIARGTPVIDFAAQTLKRHFTGKAGNDDGGGKEEVAKRMLQLYPSLRVLLPAGKVHENVTDAAAVAHMGGESAEIEWHRRQLGRNEGQLELGAPRPRTPLALEDLELPPDLAGGAPI